MYLCVRDIDFAYLLDYELFRQNGINVIHFISSLATENTNIYTIVDLFFIYYMAL